MSILTASTGDTNVWTVTTEVPPPEQKHMTLKEGVESVERMLIQNSLKRYHGCRKLAAQELRISRVTLWNKMKKYGLMYRSAP